MDLLSLRCGFPVYGGYRFRFRGQRYTVGLAGVRTLGLLGEIYTASRDRANELWLLRLRDQIRQIQSYDAKIVLCLVVERTDDPRLRILAIWLRGRCGGTSGSACLSRFCQDPDDQTRKTVARALRRMHAWGALRQMAQSERDPRIRQIASMRPPRPFPDRMTHFMRNLSPPEIASAASHKLYVAPHFSVQHGRPPKSPAYIREILHRIHRIVAGGAL